MSQDDAIRKVEEFVAEYGSIEADEDAGQLQDKLRQAFEGGNDVSSETAVEPSIEPNKSHPTSQAAFKIGDAYQACFKPLLEALSWTGEDRHLIEALPHMEEIEDIGLFASVMLRLGFQTRLMKSPISLLQRHQLPCVIVMEDGFPAIVQALTDDGQLEILRGGQSVPERYLPTDDVHQLCLFTAADTDAGMPQKFTWFYEAFLRFKRPAVAIAIVTFIINILSLSTPLFVMTVYDKVIGTKTTITLVFLAACILSIIGLELYLRVLRGKMVAFVGARFDSALLSGALKKILGLPVAMTEAAPISSQLMRLKQFQSIMGFFSGNVVHAALDLPFTILFFAVIALIGGSLGWVPVGLAATFAVIALITVPITRRNVALSGKARSKSQNFLLETMENATSIKQVGAEANWHSRFEEQSRVLSDLKFKAQFFDGMMNSIAQSLVMIAGVTTLWVGAILVIDNELSVGALIAIMMLVWKVLSPIQTMFLSLTRIDQFRETVRQINQLMRLTVERGLEKPPTVFRSYTGEIMIENLGFRYTPRSDPVLRGVNLKFSPGEVVALSGYNASGKSTLLKFMIGLYQPQSGGVYVDGLNLMQINVSELRSSVAYIPQDPIFFYGSVAQNIRLFEPTASDEILIEALADAGIDIDADQYFPEGLETRLTAKTLEKMPEGIRQRLSMARAYAKKAQIYLFDEPGAFLDREGDEYFVRKLEKLKGHATVVVATNRPSHMRVCDEIILLELGTVAGRGSPEQMIPAIMDAAKDASAATKG